LLLFIARVAGVVKVIFSLEEFVCLCLSQEASASSELVMDHV